MGNNPNGPGLFNDYTDYPCRVQLGRYTFIDVTYTEIKRNCSDSDDEVPSDNDEVPGDSEDEVPSDSDDEVPSDSDDEVPSDDDEVPSDDDDEVPSDSDDEVTKVTTMLYTVDRSSTCELKFERRHKEASLSLHDADNCSNFTGVDLEIIIRKTDKGYLEIPVPEIAAIANSREMRRKSWQTSESEDSDYVPRRHGNGKQKSESMVANDSNVKGNFNGSLFGKYFHFHKR
ncbi:pheromone-processing carboxypeptidase KEX1 isoform X2 [Lathyrus oleraceus]|uniref:pheromone-processing carboxypeptidase KEX1 isoform X2 n=1 Tax=Pisum sativum TaxID=3888 RepID=UPI001FC3E7E6|nr:pheromone-processing carboxypeptidase KEX1-like isoform X2 [Pisum sativum]